MPLRLKADLFLSKDYNTSFSMSFNGDDAMSLDKLNSATSKYDLVDIFGKIGERPVPGWSDKSPYLMKKYRGRNHRPTEQGYFDFQNPCLSWSRSNERTVVKRFAVGIAEREEDLRRITV